MLRAKGGPGQSPPAIRCDRLVSEDLAPLSVPRVSRRPESSRSLNRPKRPLSLGFMHDRDRVAGLNQSSFEHDGRHSGLPEERSVGRAPRDAIVPSIRAILDRRDVTDGAFNDEDRLRDHRAQRWVPDDGLAEVCARKGTPAHRDASHRRVLAPDPTPGPPEPRRVPKSARTAPRFAYVGARAASLPATAQPAGRFLLGFIPAHHLDCYPHAASARLGTDPAIRPQEAHHPPVAQRRVARHAEAVTFGR